MPDLRILAAVAIGGMIGSVARYGVGALVARPDFPWGTVAVNLLGSFALGFLVFNEALGGALDDEARMFLTVGVLGGFTTMSTFAVEFVGLAGDGGNLRAGAFWALNAVATVVAAVAGRTVAVLVG